MAQEAGPTPESCVVGQVDAEAVVAYNLRAIRQRRGWSQAELGERLATLTGGQVLTKSSVSAMERGFERGRRKRFDVNEVYLLSVALDVPMTYFFLPPPHSPAVLASTGRPVADLFAAALGSEAQQAVVTERLVDVDTAAAGEILANAFGADAQWPERFEAWRRERLVEVDRQYGVGLSELAACLAEIGEALGALGPLAHLGAT